MYEAALVRQRQRDQLTDLPNRSWFLDRLAARLVWDADEHRFTAVLLLDIDRFKRLNDELGYAVGDQVLQAVASRLTRELRPGDALARLGEDEFGIAALVGDTDGFRLATRLANALATPLEIDGHTIEITVSIGVAAIAPGAGTAPEAAVRDADNAMHRAKERGRHRIELADDEMRSRAASRLATELSLREALAKGELRVHYQPIVDLDTNEITGTEALARWQHPDRGMVAPSEFIAVAEDSGLVVELGRLVIGEACRQTSDWNLAKPGRRPLALSVNLSARQLSAPGLIEFMRDTLAANPGLAPRLLHLEITESVLMDDVDASCASLEALKALGVSLVIDDFGTGYSSLVYLRRFPVDALKVDRSFVAGLGANLEDTAIVSAVVGLAKALGLRTVGEGVETADQARRLFELGCDHAQGYFWSSAVPADELEGLLDGPPMALPRARARVLIVDDDGTVRRVLREALEVEGCFAIVGEAVDGAAAVELARVHQPDLVLLDLLMPGMGGLEAIEHIGQVAPRAKVAVVTSIEQHAVATDRMTGIAAFFEKASDFTAMTRRLAVLVGVA